MPYPNEVMCALGDAHELVKKGVLAEAAQIADNIWAWAEKAWDVLNDFESMLFLGYFAKLLCALNQRNRQIKLLERLCSIAESNLESRGIMATDDDIQWTGMDFVELGLAYLAVEKKRDAQAALEKGKYILEELGWLVEVEKILAGEPTAIGPSPLVKKRAYSPPPGSKGNDSPDPRSVFEEKLRNEERQAAINVAGQLAKVLFIESVTERSAVKPWDISNQQIGTNPTRDLLSEILHIHSNDCQELDTDIPLLISVPKMFAEQTESRMKALQYCGLLGSTVHLIDAPTLPALTMGSDGNAQFAMDSIYDLATFMAGGGLCLAHIIESGLLSKLWQDGIRWLLCGEFEFPSSIVESPVVAQLKDRTCDGLVEVVEHAELPESIVLPLIVGERNLCVDKRRLTEETLAKVGVLDCVCNGTFWLQCEKLALNFGVTRQNLEGRWDASAWENKIGHKIIAEYEIWVQKDGLVAANVPLWEVFRDLDLEFGKVNLRPKRDATELV